MNLQGRYRCELRIQTDGTGMSVRLAGFDQSLRTMGGAGLTLAPGTERNPNSSVTANPDDSYTLRSAFVVDAGAGATKERLATNVAAFLNGAGMRGLGTNEQLAAALLGCRRGGVACLSVTSTSPVRRAAPSRGAPPPEPVAPVPLTLAESVTAGTVVQATDPAEVGTTPGFGAWLRANWWLALGVGVGAVAVGVLLAGKRKGRG